MSYTKKILLFSAIIFIAILLTLGCNSSNNLTEEETSMGAPAIPHTINAIDNCLACHESGLNGLAPVTPHPERPACVGCHMPPKDDSAVAQQQDPVNPTPSRPIDINTFVPTTWSESPIDIARSEDEYVILAWNDVGMKCVSDNDAMFGLHYPSNTLWAQVFKKGGKPEIVTEGIELRYKAPDNRVDPASTIDFWDYVEVIHNKSLERNVGFSGREAAQGTFALNEDKKAWVAAGIPVSPYDDNGKPDPYPLYTLEAVDTATNQVLATTKVNTPISSETGCHRCHGGQPPVDGFGFGDDTAAHFLASHDRHNGTSLLADAEAGNPRFCQSCHSAANIGAAGIEGILSLSAAMHGWHAQFIQGGTIESCGMCHPSSATGGTKCLRDVHGGFDVQCGQCHGDLPLHAGSVLMKEKELPNAERSIERIEHLWGDVIPEPRTAWAQQPACLSCHPNHAAPEAGVTSYNHWVEDASKRFKVSAVPAGVMCSACHGSSHLTYANSTIDGRVTNYQPEYYQGLAAPIAANGNCQVCHTTPMAGDFKHPNMSQTFREPFKLKP